MPEEIKSLFENTTTDLLYKIGEYISNILNSILNIITKIPNIVLYIIITFLATYFICSDRYYIKDQFEYHIPRIWIKKFNNHFKEISIQLLNYLKAEVIMVIISFFIVLIGLYILSFLGFNIGFPLMIALFIRSSRCSSYTRVWNSFSSMGNIFVSYRQFISRTFITNYIWYSINV